MARSDTLPALPEFDDEKWYRVQLYKKADFAGRMFTAGQQNVQIRGYVA